MKEIRLTPNKMALVDDEDFEWLNQWKWLYQKNHGLEYAQCWEGKWPLRKMIRMHSQILQPSDGLEIDHKDGNGLNNQRCNLRSATHQQNMANQIKRTGLTSKYKGVSWDNHIGKWKAKIQANNKQMHLGVFILPEDAARVYDKAAREYFGEFAKLNFPKD